MGIEVEYEYRREDEIYRAQQSLRRMAASRNFLRSRYGLLTLLLFAVLAAAIVGAGLSVAGVLAGVALVIVWARFRRLWSVARMAADEASPVFGRRTCRLEESGVAIDAPHMKIWLDWASIREIQDAPAYIEVYYDAYRALALPKKAFPSEDRLREFLARLRAGAPAARSTQALPTGTPAPIRMRQLVLPLSALLIFLSALLVLQAMHALNRVQGIPKVQLSIDHTEVLEDGVVVLGRIKNPTRADWRLATLDLQFFDKDGRFIDQCAAYSVNLLAKAGQESHYKATCAVRDKQGPDRGNTILQGTLKEFARIEVNPGAAFRADGPSFFGSDD